MRTAGPAGAMTEQKHTVIVRKLGQVDYKDTLERMRSFTETRTQNTPDELWILEHPPVFTLGTNADTRHLLAPGNIPVVPVDRGGQVTYHGPGQLVAYTLLDLRRAKMSVRGVVEALEGAVIDTAAAYGIEAYGRRGAPGVYSGHRKLAALGLRIRRHCSYHGIAVNVAMDLKPFRRINPCGFEDLEVTQLSELCGVTDIQAVRGDLEFMLRKRFAGTTKRARGWRANMLSREGSSLER